MFTLILFCLLQLSLSQTKNQSYFDVMALQIFNIKDIVPKNLSEKQKIIITLSYDQGDVPILVICDKQPDINALINYDSIQKENCISDINAYDQKFQNQSISLIKNQKSYVFQKNFNIYQFKSQNVFVGAYSKLQSTFSIFVYIQSLYNCAKECKNGGSCFYGLCECIEGTFGDDCSILGISIKDQLKLSPDKLYYLNLYSAGSSFQRMLSNQIPIRQQCYAEAPFIDQGQILITNLLQLTNDKIEYCKNITETLQEEIKIKLQAYIIFKVYSQYDVNILVNNNYNNDNLSRIMMMIFIPLCVVFFFFLICCCVKFYKKKLEQTQFHKKLEQVEVKDYVNQYMPTIKFSQVKDIIQEEINEKDVYCSICLEQFDEQNDVKVTYCKHIYHSQCLSMWLFKIKICPLCRSPLDEKTLTSLIPQRSQTLLDQISGKSNSNNKLKITSLNSLSSLNGPNNQIVFQNLNYQRSLVLVEQ